MCAKQSPRQNATCAFPDADSESHDGARAADAGQFVPNPEQRVVIEAAADQWLLVVAGPGTGKTQVAATRLVHLLNGGLQPAQVLVLSFSRSAVATLTKRIAGMRIPNERLVEDLRHLAIRTFDSWAFRMLRQGGGIPRDLLARSHDQNIVAVTAALADETDDSLVARLGSIRHVIVDEFQDLPGVRARMVIELLSRLNRDPGKRVGFTVLGDPAQAIYRFAARASGQRVVSDPWVDLRHRMGSGLREIALAKNHRSTEKLAKVAASMRKILQNDVQGPDKKLAAMQRFLGGLPTSTPDTKLCPDWLENLSGGSSAVLTRTNGEAIRVSKMLNGCSLERPSTPIRLRLAGSEPPTPAWIGAMLSRFKPQQMSRSTFEMVYDKAEVDLGDVLWEGLQAPSREVAWRRLARASGASDLATSIDLEALRDRLAWPDAFPDDQLREEAAVYVTTIHQAKGMEFDNVALLDARPRMDGDPEDDPLEEANIGFVAITRAAKKLERIPAGSIYKACYDWSTPSGRHRQVCWGRMVNMQIGLPGDIDPQSFVSTDLHHDAEGVKDLQHALISRAAELRGHKVSLKRVSSESTGNRAINIRYDVHLQEEDRDGRLIARTSIQVTKDLLDLLWDRGLSMPRAIFNLRIADIVTIAGQGDSIVSIPEPWRSSRLWLGVTLWGTGDFKTWTRHGG